MASSRFRSRTGDLFTIPLDERRVGYGQIVHKTPGGLCWLAVFECVGLADGDADLDAIVASSMALLAKSFDVLIKHGQWKAIGHRPVDPMSIPWPAFKVHTPDGWAVEDYTGERMRLASVEEIDHLPLDITVAPIRVENATRALHGLAPWISADYDGMRPVPAARTTAYVFSQDPPPAPSGHGREVIADLLTRAVAPSSEPAPVHSRFFMTVPNRRAWWRLRSGLNQLGLHGVSRRNDGGDWTVTAEGPVKPSDVAGQLESLARSAGGSYDGHEQALI